MVDDRMSMIKIVTVGSLAAYSFAWLFQISESIGRVTEREKMVLFWYLLSSKVSLEVCFIDE